MPTLLVSLVDRALGLADTPRPRALARFEPAPALAAVGRFDRPPNGGDGEASRAAPEVTQLASILRPSSSRIPGTTGAATVDVAPSALGSPRPAGHDPDDRLPRPRRPEPAPPGELGHLAGSIESRATADDVGGPAPRRSGPPIGSDDARAADPAGRGAAAMTRAAPSPPDTPAVGDRRPTTRPADVRPRPAAELEAPPWIDSPAHPSIGPRPAGPLPIPPAGGSAIDPIRPARRAPAHPAGVLRPAMPDRTADDDRLAWPDDRPPSRAAAPIIRVSIGRIDVRAVTPPAEPVRRAAPARTGTPSLEEYLRARNSRP